MSQSLAAPPVVVLAPEPRADAVTLAQVGRALRRHWRWVAVPALAAFVGSVAFVNGVSPKYTAESKLLLQIGDSYYTRPGQDRISEPSPQIDEQAVASQVQVVMSRDLARRAIDRLGLVGNPEFDPMVKGPGLLTQTLVMLGLATNPLDRPPDQRVLDQYYDHLLVYPAGKSRIVTIEFRSKDPDLAARAANTIAELYLDMQEAAKKDTARSASTWLGSSIEALRGRVAESEAKVEAFRSRTGLLMGTNNTTIAAQQLSDLSNQLAQARSSRADAEAKAKLIRDIIHQGRTFDIPDVANNELIRRLVEQRIGLKAQLALELRTLLPEHPRIKELNAQLADLDAQIRGAAERTVRTLENDARIAGSRVETLQAAVDAQKKVVAEANENEVQLRALDREAKAQRDQLESYLTRYREATARDNENAAPPDARIVSRAVAPEMPSFPKKLPTVLLATLAALVMASGAIVARELLAERPATASGAAEMPPVGETAEPASATPAVPTEPRLPEAEPFVRPEPERTAAPAEDAPAVAGDDERYRFDELMGRLEQAEPLHRGRRVLVTGLGRPQDGADMAVALGRVLARSGRAIVIAVDAAADDPGEARGFTDLVAGEVSYAEIIAREPETGLDLVPPGTLDGALLAHEWTAAVDIALAAFDETYDWIVCLLHDDGNAPLLDLLAPRVDIVVIASDEEPDHAALVARYEAAKSAGAPDVVVAREHEAAETV